ncbi:MAG: hypothetical protein JO190_07510 [Candidatus Eremiobacteraeota bacterium]|nr:hypothetical protein [Candidatus Eremiobacteraeota bacterium]MBV8531990.1 hypothetical protein [Candidatus Eremiobacteraeota bacterium]
MGRPATVAVAALVGLLLAGCTGGGFGPSGVSLPTAGDGVQTVSDAADALDVHRSSASENARNAIGATDAVGSFVRDVSRSERLLSGVGARRAHQLAQTWTASDKRIVSGSYLHLQHEFGSVTDFCESSAGFSAAGIPSLDVTFGWQSGAFSGGARATDDRGSAVWSANAGGEIVEGAIGALSVKRASGGGSCPLSAPAFLLDGADATNAFSIPLSIAFHHGWLSNLTVANGTFANGESLDVTTSASRHSVVVDGVIRQGRTRLATFRTNAAGNGTLTITSSGAQYVVADWIVVSI